MVASLLVKPKVTDAAEACGIQPQVISRWLRDDPDFIESYRAARTRVIDEAQGLLTTALWMAAERLIEHVADKDANISLKACKMIYELSGVSQGLSSQQRPNINIENNRITVEFIYPADRPRYDGFAIPANGKVIDATPD